MMKYSLTLFGKFMYCLAQERGDHTAVDTSDISGDCTIYDGINIHQLSCWDPVKNTCVSSNSEIACIF